MEEKNNIETIENEQNQPEAAAEKTFTQAEVDEIVKKRLARVKAQADTTKTSDAELTARSNRLDCKEYVIENGLPKEYLDVIDTNNVAAFIEKVDTLQKAVKEQRSIVSYPIVNDGGEPNGIDSAPDFSNAFSVNGAAHKPKTKYRKY